MAGDSDPPAASAPVVPPRGRRRALFMLPLALVVEAVGILLLAMGYVWPFILLMTAGVVMFAYGTFTLFRLSRGRGL